MKRAERFGMPVSLSEEEKMQFSSREKNKQLDPDRKLFFAEVFAKTRKRKPGRVYKFNPDVMQFRIDTIKFYNIGVQDTGGDGTPMIERSRSYSSTAFDNTF